MAVHCVVSPRAVPAASMAASRRAGVGVPKWRMAFLILVPGASVVEAGVGSAGEGSDGDRVREVALVLPVRAVLEGDGIVDARDAVVHHQRFDPGDADA